MTVEEINVVRPLGLGETSGRRGDEARSVVGGRTGLFTTADLSVYYGSFRAVRNVDLSNVSIDGGTLNGLTINGFKVDELIAAARAAQGTGTQRMG